MPLRKEHCKSPNKRSSKNRKDDNKLISLSKEDYSDKSDVSEKFNGMTRELLEENEHDTKDGAEFEEYIIKNDNTSDMSIQDVNDIQNEQDKEKYTEDMPSRSQGDDDASRLQGEDEASRLLEVLKDYVNIQKRKNDFDLASEMTENY